LVHIILTGIGDVFILYVIDLFILLGGALGQVLDILYLAVVFVERFRGRIRGVSQEFAVGVGSRTIAGNKHRYSDKRKTCEQFFHVQSFFREGCLSVIYIKFSEMPNSGLEKKTGARGIFGLDPIASLQDDSGDDISGETRRD
jgi:hypothetical protein